MSISINFNSATNTSGNGLGAGIDVTSVVQQLSMQIEPQKRCGGRSSRR